MEKLARLAPLAVASLLITTTGHAQSPDPCEPIAGEMVSLEGEVEVQRSDAASWQAAALGQTLCEGDSVRAGALSRAAIALINEAVLRVDQNTTLRLIDIVPEEEGTSLLQLVAGIFQSFSRSPRRLAIDTPYVNATIEGTEFVLEVAENRSAVTVLEGVVALANAQGEARVASGEAAVAEAGQAPRQVIVVTPRDAVQWSLYYPPILAVEAAPGADAALVRALELARAGRNAEALAVLDEVPDARRDADYHVSRAALLLSVGRVDQAEAAIDRALEQDPEAGTAHALRSIIQVTRNQEQEALAAARRGVEADPDASAPKVALSYALQATFDLEAARDVLLEATRQDPDNPLLWARLAELHLSLGNRRDAREAAERAVELASARATTSTTERPAAVIVMPAAFAAPPTAAPRGRSPAAAPPGDLAQATPVAPAPAPRGARSPELERALVVLGFAELAEFDTAAARGNFARAIELDPADPLPHFGLGLAQIREGDLEDGRQNIEVAVALDANNSVLRSYLGKAYFEEKRDELAGQQYEIAKELDPQDPTPYLYDAIRKQTEGRPVEALQDLQTSIELNDNRAVYRSRLQLDEDRAARGTSLARIYDDLGFQELGLKEASKSLAFDPANASSHRFLSDIYGGIRRRESARVSELFQAQMLQNININPVQPSSSETNLNIVTAGGPADPGFNEFTPLFERNQVQLNASGLLGDESTWGEEVVASALYDRFSISAGQFHFETDGWRENHDIEHDIYNVFFQTAITPELNAQIELRRRESDEGDLALNFDPDAFSPNFSRAIDQDSARLGLRYSPTLNSDLLFSFIYGTLDERQEDSAPVPEGLLAAEADSSDDGYQIDGQYLFRLERFNLIAGAAFADTSGDFSAVQTLDGVPVFEFPPQEFDTTHVHPYAYGSVNFPDPVTWTLGLSYDDFESGDIEIHAVNPKFGAQWNITDDLLLRGAVMRMVKPAVINNRTLEPTQVAGFNQLFDDAPGDESLRWGVGLDWSLTSSVFVGVEATWRDLDLAGLSAEEGQVTFDADEQTHRAYVNWTPLPELALGAELVYDRFEADRSPLTTEFPIPEDVETISVPLTARYFHRSGFFAGIGATFVYQEVVRSPDNLFGLTGGDDSFFVVDASAGYRLPNRLGIASVQVSNLLDEDFQFQDDSYREFQDRPSIGPYIPDLQVVGRISLNF